MEGPTVFKQIKNFEEYGKRQKTSLVAIQKAYATLGGQLMKPSLLVTLSTL